MCVVSMVHDHYGKQPDYWWQGRDSILHPVNPTEAQKRIEEFHEAVDAAEKVDTLTGQPDCVDPAKLTLLERIERIERELGLT